MALVLMVVWATRVAATESASGFSPQDIEFFEREVRPLLVEQCYECHSNSSKRLEGGLRLDSRAAVLVGGDTTVAVVPGHPEQSLLIDAINYGDLFEMPPQSKLPPEAIETLVEWVRRGVPWSEEEPNGSSAIKAKFDVQQRKASHWAWSQVENPSVPEVSDPSWPLDPLDQFILAKLDANGLRPAKPADPYTLIRRIYFDLVGLPPSPEQVEDFAIDPSPAALARLVDDLLASPHFGERWGRHWLDLMRYAESRGHEHDHASPNAWQYRDYVIRAFNIDLPYDRFVTEHIAGDLLEEPRRHPTRGFNESVLATGFWYLGEWVHSPVDIRQDELDRFDNAIDVFSKSFLGLTVSCARCHDHKFDAVSQRDYYALIGFLQSSAYRQVRFETSECNREVARQLDALRSTAGRQLGRLIATACRENLADIDELLMAACEAIVAGATPAPVIGANRQQEQASIDVVRGKSEESNGQRNRLNEFGARHDLAVDRLLPWASELALASVDQEHPLYGFALTAAAGEKAAGEWIVDHSREMLVLPDSAQIVVDYRTESAFWQTDGPAYGSRALRRGEILPNSEASEAIAEIVQQGRAELQPELANLGLTDGTEDDPSAKANWMGRPGKIIRTPTVELRGGKLYYLLKGGACAHAVVDSHRLVLGPLHGRTRKEINSSDELRWVEHDLTEYRGHRVHAEFGPNGDAPLQILMVVESDAPPPLPNCSPAILVAEKLEASASVAKKSQRISQLIHETLECLENNEFAGDDALLVLAQWLVERPQLWDAHYQQAIEQVLASYRQQREQLLASLCRESMTAPAIWDGDDEDEFLLVRGNSRTPTELVAKRFLSAIAGEEQVPINHGSGRLELARRLLEPSNPFPSRVMVNRIWQHLVGRGIVPTVDNFGVLGQMPSHPALLDHLAVRFVENGWSMKQLIRSIVLSRTYQMASHHDALAAESDPENLLIHRMMPRRLESEVIRDSMLALSGRLNSELFGPSVPVYLTEFMQGRGRPAESGPLDGNGRRSIYVSVRRNFLSPMMLAFDTPQPARPVGLRSVSNVPAQALILMNDPFVQEQASHFARRLLKWEGTTQQRIERLYEEMFARKPRTAEVDATMQFLAVQGHCHGLDETEGLADLSTWTDLCHAMFNVKEFIFIQ
ncbi:MAG: PSD1 domain-containing protein [Planctomycetales bacterium]|nr:PSD1 domain-containing protein [Planctomycetales bacterium]